jgi:ABC-2 type transport system ATP-binding protein/ribosome-dependent ATPase
VTALVEARGVSQRYGAVTAVDGVDLTIRSGEVVGLLGANGAGKTTLIRVLLGLVAPSAGSVRLFGERPSVRVRRRIGYVPQGLGLYADLSVAENWHFVTTAFGAHGAPPLPSQFEAVKHATVGSLPLGAQRRLAFVLAMSHEPELFVLDEPTSGVSALGRARLWESIRQAAGAGAGVLVTTHNMEEAEECDRLLVMANGRVVAAGPPREITAGRVVLEVRCENWARAFRVLDEAGVLAQLSGGALRLSAAGSQAGAVTELLRLGGVDAIVEPVPATLEEVFVEIVGSADALP